MANDHACTRPPHRWYFASCSHSHTTVAPQIICEAEVRACIPHCHDVTVPRHKSSSDLLCWSVLREFEIQDP